MPLKLGRQPRSFNPRVPHYSALRRLRRAPAAPPPSCDYSAQLPADLGMMLNDTLGDCTCAAVYHARQTWTANANPPIDTEPDAEVEQLYESACGYVPGNPATDQGGNEQTVLSYLVNTGAPLQGGTTDKLLAFVEIDQTNATDVMAAIYECGVAYIGFNVPAYLMAGTPPDTWDVNPSGDNSIVGGHAVILIGYQTDGAGNPTLLTTVSWGRTYKMTWAFFQQFTEEVYALADQAWIENSGQTPLGLTTQQLEAQMAAISEPLQPQGA